MSINRFNYQKFFLLYADNELKADEREAVEHFVQQNLDLEEELTMLRNSILIPDMEVVFDNKELLLQFESTGSFIHPGNFEELAVAYADDELTDTEKKDLETFININPDFRQEFELIKNLRLNADDSIIFPDKKSLYRYEKQRKPVVMMWWQMSAAAIILITAGLLLLNRKNDVISVPPVLAEIKDSISKVTSQNKSGGKKVNTNTNYNIKQTSIEAAVKLDKNIVKADSKVEKQALQSGRGNKIRTNSNREKDIVKAQNDKELKNNSAVVVDNDNSQEPLKSSHAGIKPQTQPDKTTQTMASLDASIDRNHNRVPDQTMLVVNAVSNNNYSKVIAVADTDDDEDNGLVSGIPVKNPLRGILRKASRFIDKTTTSRTSKKSGLHIGNIEIAFQ